MILHINSEITPVSDEINTVEKLLAFMNIPANGIAVGLNNRLIEARNFSIAELHDQDRVMIIKAAYGG